VRVRSACARGCCAPGGGRAARPARRPPPCTASAGRLERRAYSWCMRACAARCSATPVRACGGRRCGRVWQGVLAVSRLTVCRVQISTSKRKDVKHSKTDPMHHMLASSWQIRSFSAAVTVASGDATVTCAGHAVSAAADRHQGSGEHTRRGADLELQPLRLFYLHPHHAGHLRPARRAQQEAPRPARRTRAASTRARAAQAPPAAPAAPAARR